MTKLVEEGGEGAGLVCDGRGKAEGALTGAALLLHCAGGLVGGLGKPAYTRPNECAPDGSPLNTLGWYANQ